MACWHCRDELCSSACGTSAEAGSRRPPNRPIDPSYLRRQGLSMPGSEANEAREGVEVGGYVLVVDDNADNTTIAAELLRNRGFEVEVAGNGEKALGAIERRRPDMILLDVMMPGMDGMQG